MSHDDPADRGAEGAPAGGGAAERLRQHLAERFGPGEGPADPTAPPEDATTEEASTEDAGGSGDGDPAGDADAEPGSEA